MTVFTSIKAAHLQAMLFIVSISGRYAKLYLQMAELP